MFDYVKGLLTEKSVTSVTVEAQGVGYEMSIPVSTYERLPALNETVKIYTHYHVREDAHKLYGFWTADERAAFRQLMTVSQIGPKVALSVLSGVSVAELARAVNLGEEGRLRGIPGVGPKTAQRVVMELRGKLGPVRETGDEAGSNAVSGVAGKSRTEAFEAMLSLGYAEKQVIAALARVEKVVAGDAPVEEWIRKALQVI
jgi:Holliday junction DNA helicase RuvA